MRFALLLCLCACARGERWSWPEPKVDAAPRRIDNKLSFADTPSQEESNLANSVLNDGDVRNAPFTRAQYIAQNDDNYEFTNYRNRRPNNEEWLSMYGDKESKQCKCTTDTNCITRNDLQHTCSAGERVCCYERIQQDYMNDANKRQYMFDETGIGGFFSQNAPLLMGAGASPLQTKRPVLVGPDGPTGVVGPPSRHHANHGNNYFQQDVLVGPGGPTGIVGPNHQNQEILVGPDGHTGIIGPNRQNQDVLVGPGGPTGIIGTSRPPQGVLVGTEGPTGVIGPIRQVQGVLVGPNGPSGTVGPNRQVQVQGVLVGPAGPTGQIGPQRGGQLANANGDRGVLIGPGGPTGVIGPVRGGYGFLANTRQNRRHKYFSSDLGRYPSYRRGDVL